MLVAATGPAMEAEGPPGGKFFGPAMMGKGGAYEKGTPVRFTSNP